MKRWMRAWVRGYGNTSCALGARSSEVHELKLRGVSFAGPPADAYRSAGGRREGGRQDGPGVTLSSLNPGTL